MAYDALTIDTQTVYANGRHLDRGLVGQLDQYKDGLIQVILSEVVVREINSMLITKAKTTLDALEKAIREGFGNGQISEEQRATLEGLNKSISSPEDHAKKQLKSFFEATGAQVIPAEKASVNDVLGAYFKKRPPFSSQGKKDEFPDAISLMSLEAWAKENNKKILAVSNDGDWKSFAAQSDWIDCIDDLGAAMSALEAAAAAAEVEARALLSRVASGDLPDLEVALSNGLNDALERESPYVEFDGPMPGEDEGASLSLVDYEIAGIDEGTTEITIVRVRADGFVMRVPISIVANALVDISFSIYDSIDKDHVPMGSTSVEREIEFEAFALVDCYRYEGETEDGAKVLEYDIFETQLIGTPGHVDIGYVDYSLADKDYDFDPDEWIQKDNPQPPAED